ncbi:hypothetical protein SJDPG5_04375 [Porphyromonas gingivalis SJD5]|nr:hypothetical protein HMPREF1989_01252 [Porphyromonas gingivalis F0566]OWR79032.1 hypothetical protein SJDPG5_04375 [Porphyromonas gingivalis SJD5]
MAYTTDVFQGSLFSNLFRYYFCSIGFWLIKPGKGEKGTNDFLPQIR